MKATSIAPANLPFVKYMGRKDEVLRLPENASLSMNLSNLLTTTTVEFSDELEHDDILLNGEREEGEGSRGIRHLDRIRQMARINLKARVVSKNSFPTGTGLSSSSSGFAALTVAGAAAAGLKLSERELTILARQGSGSACRSIPDGFVEWKDAATDKESYAFSLYPSDYWDITDIVAIVSTAKKKIKSSTAHKLVLTSPYFQTRLYGMPEKIRKCKAALKAKNFELLGELAEKEALDLHVIFMSAGIIYLTPQSLELIKLVPEWRAEGLPVYFTLNTGQDVHLLCEKKDCDAVKEKLKNLSFVRDIIVNEPAKGARLVEGHLF
ncbi:diphosphomevalonate decarboxylase [Candidatus Peribacteria bacterium RIFCSPLOWO2_01_FULL_51_18]|nr:MAG: diphosphomevalonate decarboxylase [Candidatus Peribacteria bacterium RIFCSPHIGHO2_02_FULL_51_15]OGJ66640.1 MAG: diphosphomevalonate decarboxylase [Candidatus Peribacteria bacterium RIFCSPLOWO2_01_FULL_51_18]OGJ69425.1 MAG: diphosphomevalonate decarboxylase [Candidatus Peribacteria bacterium RIFCSPLOWO2_02_FULL_51_10]